MKKFFLILILFFFSNISFVLSCDFSKFKIGKYYSNFEKEIQIFSTYRPIKGVIGLSIPMYFHCDDKNLDGSNINLFFYDEKIIRILFENSINSNRPLFNLANKTYKVGFKKNQKLVDNFEPENYSIEKNNVYYLYGTLIGLNENEGKFKEIFEIVDKEYEDLESKESQRQEE